jgi:hypothetical protein
MATLFALDTPSELESARCGRGRVRDKLRSTPDTV